MSGDRKAALVTGASRGIGRAIALRLAAGGSDVALVARDESRLAEVAELVRARGARAAVIPADLADGAAVEDAVARAQEALGAVHHLVANAGVTADQLTMRLKPEEWDRVMAVNLTGAFRLTRAALGGMVRARYGRIVLISSVAGLMGNPGQAAYAASKAGLIGFAKSVSKELGSRNVTVNVVAPGLIETDMARALPEARREEMVRHVPLGRLGTAEEVAGVVAFLLGEDAGYMTGAVLNVSGGLHM
ncbi:MAG TPA: 3-oxoacyl-[acyl-carrier-protein] reductase [Candidatus Polarisedimenticolia bacterium]|nr:3-oxoacyl-[acyl-carrier-protein] reductase [Candidatus Polarisedimenticolia bacterium]